MESWKWLLPGWDWTVDCVRFGGDWANSIFYLILLYFNHIARNVRIAQNEKLHKLIFYYEVGLYRALQGTSLASICCGDQLWFSRHEPCVVGVSAGLGLRVASLGTSAWSWLGSSLLEGVVWTWGSGQELQDISSQLLWLSNTSNLQGWIAFWVLPFSCLLFSPVGFPSPSYSVSMLGICCLRETGWLASRLWFCQTPCP